MTKQEQYNLSFQKINIPDWGTIYQCTHPEVANDSYFLSSILNQVSDKEPEDLLEEINNAINGEYLKSFILLIVHLIMMEYK